MKQINSLLALVLSILVGLNTLSAQGRASVVGTVIDERTREAIPYVQITIKGTTIGTTTDAHGNYIIKDLPTGTHTLVASFLGYATVSQRITLSENQKRHLDLYMHEQSIDLEGVVVSANRHETLRRLAPTLVTVLGAETFQKTNSETLSQVFVSNQGSA